LVWSPVLRKFPDLKFALSEADRLDPYFLERIDYNYDRHHAWTGRLRSKLPASVQRTHPDVLH